MTNGPTWLHFVVFVLAHLGVVGGWLVRMGKHEQSLTERMKTVEERLEKGSDNFSRLSSKIDGLSQQVADLTGYLRGRDDERALQK